MSSGITRQFTLTGATTFAHFSARASRSDLKADALKADLGALDPAPTVLAANLASNIAIPLIIYGLIGKFFGEKKDADKKEGEISAEKALASQQQSSNEEMLYDAEDAVVGDVQR